jgi:hypothetical protein
VNEGKEGDWLATQSKKLIARFTGRAHDLGAMPGRTRVSRTAIDQSLEEPGAAEYMKYEDVYLSEISNVMKRRTKSKQPVE